MAALPASRTFEFVEKIKPVFSQLEVGENVWLTSVNNLNPIVHPPMVLFNAGRIESTGGQGWNLYADGATESVAKVMLAMDEERMSVLAKLGTKGIPFKDSFESMYEKYSLGKKPCPRHFDKARFTAIRPFRPLQPLIRATSTKICPSGWFPGRPSAACGACQRRVSIR